MLFQDVVELGIKFAGWLLGWSVFWYLRKPRPSGSSLEFADITVVIPARNESQNLHGLLPSLFASNLSNVIVVNDHSTDDTQEVAKSYGAHVLSSAPLPSNWTGKTWSCFQGAQAVQTPWILFLDADCKIEGGTAPLFFKEDVAEYVASYLPYHRMQKPYEQLSFFFNALMAAGVMTKTPKLFGQCMFIQKTTYLNKASHEKVAGVVLENLHLARHLQAQGILTKAYLGQGHVSMRMFPEGPGQMHESWLKAFSSGASQVEPQDLIKIILWISAASYAGYSFLGNPSILSFGFYVLFGLQVWSIQKKLGNYSAWMILLYPLALTYFHVIFFWSLLRKKLGLAVTWRGRRVA